ncbi:hypothetical protein M3Y95_00109600 [Aphelenchoides besseyi]|nr:hypothetical protein M3Y95_00109600 [Aphelenchoides besseyi]
MSSKKKKQVIEKPKKSSKIPTAPKPRVPSPQSTIYEASDYDDEFEDYDSQSESAAVQKDEVVSSPISTARSTEKTKTSVPTTNEMEESVILRRVAQSQRTGGLPLPNSFNQQQRPVTSASRTFRFDHTAAVNTEAALEGAAKFHEIKDSLASEFISSIDVYPNRRADVYSHLMSQGDKQQRYTETNEDNLFNWTQTTPRETSDFSTQYPNDVHFEENKTPPTHLASQDRTAKTERFLQFVDLVGQVCISLLASQPNTQEYYFPMRSNFMFSNGFVQLTPFESKAKPIGVTVIVKSTPIILVGFYLKMTDEGRFVNQTAIVVYELAEDPKPKRVLITTDEVTDFCCTSTAKEVVFAGMRNGSCVLWDMSETLVFESPPKWTRLSDNLITIQPAYNTTYSYVEKKGAGMKTTLNVQIVQVGSVKTDSVGEQQQFVSLNAGGVVTIWAVGRETHAISHLDSDLGLRPNSTVRLIKISVILCSSLAGFGTGSQIALNMHVSVFNSKDVFVGMQQGGLVRIARGIEGPRHYFLNEGRHEWNRHLAITAVHSSPFEADFFAAGTSDGVLLIYNINQNVPLTTRAIQSRERKRPKEISEIAWSLSHAQILYVIYDQQFLAIWNLADYQVQPTLIDVFDEFKAPVQRVFCWKDSRQTSIISMLLESGDVLVHQLARPHETNVLLRDLLKTK